MPKRCLGMTKQNKRCRKHCTSTFCNLHAPPLKKMRLVKKVSFAPVQYVHSIPLNDDSRKAPLSWEEERARVIHVLCTFIQHPCTLYNLPLTPSFFLWNTHRKSVVRIVNFLCTLLLLPSNSFTAHNVPSPSNIVFGNAICSFANQCFSILRIKDESTPNHSQETRGAKLIISSAAFFNSAENTTPPQHTAVSETRFTEDSKQNQPTWRGDPEIAPEFLYAIWAELG